MPLAAGCLAAAAAARGREDPGRAGSAQVTVIPRRIADHGGDAAILSWLVDSTPDLAGFSASMWNVDRSLWLARRLREKRPGTRVVLGGPEVVAGAGVLASPHADFFVTGEGEAAFARLLDDLVAGRGPPRVLAGGKPLDLSHAPDPYLCGAVETRPGDPIHLETTRGCAHHCSYCHYARSMPGLRSFPRGRLAAIFPWARERGASEVYLLDPSFTSARGWEERLRVIAAANTVGLPLHAEVRLETVSAERAALLAAAGIRSVEAGLQSTNPAALRAVRRSWQRDAFVRGAALLRSRGIEVRTGIILGLPADTPEGFAATMDFVREQGLGPGLEVHPLAVLPGTALREEAAPRGIRYLPWPPWEVVSTPTMSEEQVRGAMRRAEGELGAGMFPPVLPRFRADLDGFASMLDLRAGPGPAAARPECVASTLTILVRPDQLGARWFLEETCGLLLSETPHTLFQLVVESDLPLDPAAAERAVEALHFPGHYFNRANWLNDDPQGKFSVRLFRLASAAAARQELRAGAGFETGEMVVRFDPALLDGGGRLLRGRPLLLIDRDPGPAARAALGRIYAGSGELLLEADRRL